jgi:hypothetical protein
LLDGNWDPVDTPCTRSMTGSMSLPCAHDLSNILDDNRRSTMADIHRQWWIDHPIEDLSLPTSSSEPLVQSLASFSEQFHTWPEHQRQLALGTIQDMAATPAMPILEPVALQGRGRPIGSLGRLDDRSTRRDPSGFELMTPVVRRCVVCREQGHNSRRCPQNNR